MRKISSNRKSAIFMLLPSMLLLATVSPSCRAKSAAALTASSMSTAMQQLTPSRRRFMEGVLPIEAVRAPKRCRLHALAEPAAHDTAAGGCRKTSHKPSQRPRPNPMLLLDRREAVGLAAAAASLAETSRRLGTGAYDRPAQSTQNNHPAATELT